MSEAPLGFTRRYGEALADHLLRSGEQALHEAYELGRRALNAGLGVLDITLLHHEALADLMLERDMDGDADMLELAAEFLAECLSPFEMTLRGYQEANTLLSQANARLTQANAATAAANALLKAEMEDRRKAEEALLHAKKLHAVGLLAGGVAHHFNNLLTVVLGNIEMARRRVGDDERTDRLLIAARRGAERGAEVTRQLLSFSRQQMLQPRKIDPAVWLTQLEPLLSGALRGDIIVDMTVPPALPPIEVDPAQLELAILNLAVNARDAMPQGGMLYIGATNRHIADGRLDLARGDYVTIEVQDTGTGIAPEILPQVFEPFFSTKGAGPGAGLGLSQVHGFTHQSGGAVEMESPSEGGTIVRLYLPASTAADAEDGVSDAEPPLAEGSGRLLVVEDDEDVASLAHDLLESMGYSVRLAHRAQAALDLLQRGEKVDLVFSDVIMPGGMSGLQLAQALRRRYPDLPVLLTTGYNDAVDAMAKNDLPFITKPYGGDELQRRIEELLRAKR